MQAIAKFDAYDSWKFLEHLQWWQPEPALDFEQRARDHLAFIPGKSTKLFFSYTMKLKYFLCQCGQQQMFLSVQTYYGETKRSSEANPRLK